MIDNQANSRYFSRFCPFRKRRNFERYTRGGDSKKGELNCKNYSMRCVKLKFKTVWRKEKSDFCCVKFAILYHLSNSQNVFLIWKGGVCRLTFYGSGWSLTETPLRCWQKIIFILDFKLCIRSSISQNSSCKSILSCSKS